MWDINGEDKNEWSQRTKAGTIKDNKAKSHNQNLCDSMDVFLVQVKSGPCAHNALWGRVKARSHMWAPDSSTMTRAENCIVHK